MPVTTIGGGSPVDIPGVKGYISGELAAMPVISVAGLLFGVKLTIDVICDLTRIYNRHRSNVISQLPPTVVGALDVLVAACDIIDDLNPPGPR